MQPFSALKNRYLLVALALTVVYHGGLLFFTFKRTYDAYVHIFFADHYARAWFDHWEPRWYTGFPMTSYPPGSQQSIALVSSIVGLQNGFIIVQLIALLVLFTGVFRFSRVWVSEEAAGYAALLAVFASGITETVHVFGQLPTTFSLGLLLNALPYVYQWLDEGDIKILIIAWAVVAATTAGHHVTTLFGAVFFIGPIMAMSIVQKFRQPLPDEPPAHPAKVRRYNFRPLVIRRLRRIIPVTGRAGVFGVGMIFLLLLVVMPYWIWSTSDPISQVSIPHASRDSFIENTAAGLVFWIIPYGITLIALPYAFYKGMTTRAWALTLSLGLLFVLGTGGTTPIPRMLLRGAFDILTLDRFTFWATILMLPLLGEFVVSLRRRGLAKYLKEQFGFVTWRVVQISLLLGFLIFSLFTANFTQFRRIQPESINMQPIVNFLEKDQHWRWRYLTLGFGDQLAWLSAQTTATTPDGNYHSARRLPELTTTPIERLEGAKFRGMPGIGSLQQFLAVPDKYNLKFIFSNDQFYDPILFFSGWHKLQRLENGIVVWEREDIPPLPEILPRKEIPIYQRIMWGLLPMMAIFSAILAVSSLLWAPYLQRLLNFIGVMQLRRRLLSMPGLAFAQRLWHSVDGRLRCWSELPQGDDAPVKRWQFWRKWLQSIPRPKPAPPSARFVRSLILLLLLISLTVFGAYRYTNRLQDPESIIVAYYDDLDFRRFGDAHARLDPETRPALDQFLLELSVKNGLLASYGKLDSVKPRIVESELDRVVVEADTIWVTALQEYETSQRHVMVKRDGHWYIMSDTPDVTIPPDQFFRRGEVAYHSQGRRRVTTETTAFADVLDRPELQILSSRLVRKWTDACGFQEEHDDEEPSNCYRYSVVGELINTDVDPADLTVTAILYDEEGNELSQYNAQQVIMHKLMPKEVTPFRVDFEGVAGAVLDDLDTAGDFHPDAYSPLMLEDPVAAFEVYGKAVVTGRDLDRSVAVQDIQVTMDEEGQAWLSGEVRNFGLSEATIPHVFITYYDAAGQVAWVDHYYLEEGIRPQRSQSFNLPITQPDDFEALDTHADVYANILRDEVSPDAVWGERIQAPPELDYETMRINVHYFVGGAE